MSALLDATLDDVLFQPTSMLAICADDEIDSRVAACCGIADATTHRVAASDTVSAEAPVSGTHAATPAQLTTHEPAWRPSVPSSENGQLQSSTVLTSATELSLGARSCRPAFGFSDSHARSGDADLMDLLAEDSVDHDILDQIRNVLQLGGSADSYAFACGTDG